MAIAARKPNPLAGPDPELAPDYTYPAHLAQWHEPAPEPAPVAPTPLSTGLRPPVALDLPTGGPTLALAPGAVVPPVLTDPPPEAQEPPDPAVTGEPAGGQPPAVSPEPQAAPAFGAGQVPGSGVKVETQRQVLSPESKAALERGDQLSSQQGTQADQLAAAKKTQTQAQVQNDQAIGRIDSLKAQYEERVAEEAALKEELAQARFREADEKAKQKIDTAQQRVDAANAAAGKDYYADKSTGFKIVQALLTFSSIKNSYTLGEDPNDSPFMRMTRETIARDKEVKMAEVRASKEALEAARKGPEEHRQFLLDARADIDATTARQLQITLTKAAAMKASRKVDPKLLEANIAAANAATEADLLETRQGYVNRDLERAKRLDRTVTTTAAPLTAAQMKAAGGGAGGHPLFSLKGDQVGWTPNLKLSNDAAEKRAGALDSQRIGAQLAAHIREYGMEVLPGKAKSDRTALKKDLISALVKARSGTAASKEEKKDLTETVMPNLVNQVFMGRGDIAGAVENFIGRETTRYNNFIESSASDPKQARALLGGSEPAAASASPTAAKLDAAIVKAMRAGDKEAVADLRARRQALGR